MVSTTLRRIPVSADKPWSEDLNRLIDVVLGNNGGRLNLTGYDGTIADPITGAVTGGQYALPIQAASGLHLDAIHSTGAPHLLTVNDTSGVVMGGAVNITGATTLSTLHATGAVTLDSTLGVTGTSTLGVLGAGATTVTSLHATSTGTFDLTLSASGQISALATPTSVATSGAVNIGTSLNVTTSATIGTTLVVTGLTTLTALTTSGNVTVGGLLTGNAGLTVSSGSTTLQATTTTTLNASGLISGGAGLTISAGNTSLVGTTTVATLTASNTLTAQANFLHTGSAFAFFGSAAQTKQTITGSRGGNVALANVLAAGANHGLWNDSTTV